MKTLGTILTSFVTLAFAIIGGLWTAYTVLTTTMDSKVADAKADMRIERAAQMGEIKVDIQGVKESIGSVKEQIGSLDRKVDILIRRNN
jgi:hypothetical protein